MTRSIHKELPEKIFILDDQFSRLVQAFMTPAFPEAKFFLYQFVNRLFLDLDAAAPPDLVVVDASVHGRYPEEGAKRALEILEKLHEIAPDKPWPDLFLCSADARCSLRAKEILVQRLADRNRGKPLTLGATNMDELSLLGGMISPERRVEHYNWDSALTGFRNYLNRHYGFSLPTTQASRNAYIMGKSQDRPNDILHLMSERVIGLEEGLAALAPLAQQAVQESCGGEVEKTAAGIDFYHASGRPVVGPAVFDATAAAFFAGTGNKPIYILRESSCEDVVQILDSLAGLVIFEGKGKAHLALLAESHGVPALIGYAAADRSSAVPQARLETNADATEGVSLLLAPTDLDRPGAIVRMGDRVTLDTNRRRLVPREMRLSEKVNFVRHAWLPVFANELEYWHEQTGCPRLKFDITVDSLARTPRGCYRGIGLVRSEHLILEDQRAMAAMKEVLLANDPEACRVFEEETALHFEQIWGFAARPNQIERYVRFRLLDAPPAEFFSPVTRDRMEQAFGDADLRGVKLAKKRPELYEAQVKGVLSVLRSSGASPVDFLVPMVETAEDAVFARCLIQKVAQDKGAAPESYRFGVMLETLEAGQDIERIAPLCDFISLGTNDYTASFFSCARDDWARRNALTAERVKKRLTEPLPQGSSCATLMDATGLLLRADPFVTLDPMVCANLSSVIRRARQANPRLQISLCGAHATDLPSLLAAREWDLESVSVPPTGYNLFGLPLLYMLDTFRRVREGREPARPSGPLPPTAFAPSP